MSVARFLRPHSSLFGSDDAAGPSQGEPTQFELNVSERADAIVAAGKTGYAWNPVDELLKQELDVSSTRCKQANNSGRAANVLTESNDKDVEHRCHGHSCAL
jgi:hypothetical protein